jgi:hypothetical protein
LPTTRATTSRTAGDPVSTKGKGAVSSTPTSSKSRKRLAAWLAFGAAGLATGAVWASGFATATGANGTTGESPAMAKTAPTPATSALATTVSRVNDLSFDWDGRWGSLAANTIMFKVDLTGSQFNGKTYNVAVLLANTSTLTGWASLQLEFSRADKLAGGSCAAADLTGSPHSALLNVDDQDAGVYWNALAGDAVYCVGVEASTGDDAAGTFLRAAQDTAPTGFPSFIATVDRAS